MVGADGGRDLRREHPGRDKDHSDRSDPAHVSPSEREQTEKEQADHQEAPIEDRPVKMPLEHIENGEAEGKSLLDAMRDGKLDGMQDFDSVIKDLIETNVITVEDGLGFATNQNNLLLSLKGLTSGEDFIRTQGRNMVPNQTSQRPAGFSLNE